MSTSLTEHLLVHKILTLDGFVSADTAINLYNDMTRNSKFNPSMVSDKRGEVNAVTDTAYNDTQHYGRISETAFHFSFSPRALNALENITKDMAGILGVEVDQFEPWQCTRYFTGGLFDYHDDCGNWASNERLYTVMLTVKAPDFGGATHFPRLNKMIESKSSRVLIWRNLNEDFLCDGMSQHSGMPVGELGTEDEKMILVTWVRRFKYVS